MKKNKPCLGLEPRAEKENNNERRFKRKRKREGTGSSGTGDFCSATSKPGTPNQVPPILGDETLVHQEKRILGI
jgi:hypothetical protein